jgi:hypothetical protein
MASFSYCLVLDGDAFSAVVAEQPDRETAVAHGQSMLLMALRVRDPAKASLAVFAGDSEHGGAPLGRWDWTFAAADEVWTPAA